MMETPSISSYTRNTSTYIPATVLNQNGLAATGFSSPVYATQDLWLDQNFGKQQNLRNIKPSIEAAIKPIKDETMLRRIVQVFIADTDENVPLDRSVIYKGEQKITDLTDQELFFEVDIKKILDEHNTYRATLINKKVKERTENLEPVKIRDLRMVVTTVAEFK